MSSFQKYIFRFVIQLLKSHWPQRFVWQMPFTAKSNSTEQGTTQQKCDEERVSIRSFPQNG